MKKLITICILFSFAITGCNKSNNEVKSQAPEAKPTAFFKIKNLKSDGWILESNVCDFDNQSKNGYTYHWDFGNGLTSEYDVPQNIAFWPCGNVYTITLTAKNKSGDVSTYSETFHILCRGRQLHNNGATPGPIHLNSTQVNNHQPNE